LPENDENPPAPWEAGAGARGYPRPLLRRAEWLLLDGEWEFALDPRASWDHPDAVVFDRRIIVPFAPETKRSGIADTSLFRACWYRREVVVPRVEDGQRLLLHFGAVDYDARVWVDGHFVGGHEGGYTPFTIDVTEAVRGRNTVAIALRAHDDPADLAKPRGKQDWKLEPHSIWYPRTSGIWQSVWMERVCATHVEHIRWTPNLERWELGIELRVAHAEARRTRLRVRVSQGAHVLVEDDYAVAWGEVHRRIALSDPGIDDFRNELFWSPARPTLLDAELELYDALDGTVLDRVWSYTALRSVAVKGDRFVLNGRDVRLRMVLDQGYWEETGLTAPDDDAIRRDVELTRAMGFNGARKHQKIEDPRYLYWADRLGLMVWEEMPSAYRFSARSVERLTRQWVEAMQRDLSHPCIVAWVPFNESWGVPNLPDNAFERHYVQALYHLTHTIDTTRPVVGNDGWEAVATDILGIHDYDVDPDAIGRRYPHDRLPLVWKRERPGGRALVLGETMPADQPIVLSEFGGLALRAPGASTWGYSECADEQELAARYQDLLGVVGSLGALAGFCYTQLADTYQEANGLLRADRTPKFPLRLIFAATQGRAPASVGPEAGDESAGPSPPETGETP
jgi:beta-galactosidase/beta-glucuronidase